MAVDVERFKRLKQQADDLRAKAQRAAGARDAALAELKSQFNVDTLEAADKLLKELTEEAKLAEDHYNQLFAAFEKEWGAKFPIAK